MRARQPDEQGFVVRDGVRISYEVYGQGAPTVLLLPSWPIVPSRVWKSQVPYLARHFRVVTFDPRGNGRSDHIKDPLLMSDAHFIADALAVLDATNTDKAVLVGASAGCQWALGLAVDHPQRLLGWFAISPSVGGLGPPPPERLELLQRFDEDRGHDEGWGRYNRYSWLRDYRGFAEFFFSELLPEPHSTKHWEDCVGWAMQTHGETLVATWDSPNAETRPVEELCASVGCPVVVVHGTADTTISHANGARLAELTNARFVSLEGTGHLPYAREPVKVNLLIREFVESVAATPSRRTWTRSLDRRPRALYLCSPIGLGHVRRDLAIANALRELRPDLQIDWLTQPPVTGFLEHAGESVHPASTYLASESGHIEGEAGEHDLHVFQAIRTMDEVLVANFMVFQDLVDQEHYDLWVGDEAWDVDHYLHENPELKRAPFAWLTDFVGWLPMPDGGEREAFLTADYNAEMIEHVARFPRLRDKAVFVGDADDIVTDALGPGLPTVRAWTEEHFDFAGYVTGFGTDKIADRDELRARLGYMPDEKVCLVSVGGSAVGEHLLRRVVESYAEAKDQVPGLRMVVVAGPRIDPESFRSRPDLEIRGFVPDLHLHHAACDLGIVQGGLTTTMELTAAQRPFLYFPLGHHFEQRFHVRHRLERHGAGRCMDYPQTDPDGIASAIVEEIDRPVKYLDVPSDGAVRVAAHLAELI